MITKQSSMQLGFSLIELFIALSIMMLLATIAIVSFGQANAGARDSQRKADLETFKQAMVQYRVQQGGFPDLTESGAQAFSEAAQALNEAGFLSQNLVDPRNVSPNVYYVDTIKPYSEFEFTACTQLEADGSEYCVGVP